MAYHVADPTLVVQLYQQALGDLTHLIAFSLLDKRSFASEMTKQVLLPLNSRTGPLGLIGR